MKKVKITVLKTTLDKELAKEYGADGLTACPMLKEGQVFYADYAKPEGFCDEAWKAIYQYAFALSHGAEKELFQNVRYDTAANPLLYDIKSIKTVISMVGPNRLLYGSDFPLLLYPSVKREMDFSLFIHDITQNANLTEQEWTQFMGKNLLEFIT